MTRTLTLLALLTACTSAPSSDNDELLDEYEAAVTAIHELTDGYVVGAAQGSSTDSITELQITYAAALDLAVEDVEHVLEDLEGCEMMADGDTSINEAHTSILSITDNLDALLLAHADHTDISECQEASEEHEGAVDEEIEAMEAHHDVWHDMEMSCEMHDEGTEVE